jgi:predicted ATPase
LIDEELAAGRTLAAIRADEQAFQGRVFAEKLAREAALPENEVILFDRGLQDTLAFLRLRGIAAGANVVELCSRARYMHVFLLQQLPDYQADYARSETPAEAAQLETLLEEAYAGHPLTRIPPLPLDERVELIARAIRRT